MPVDKVKDPQVLRTLDDVIEQYHSTLQVHEVKVGLEWAYRKEGDDSGKPLLKLHGSPCIAVVRLIKEGQRLWGMPDAIIRIDREWWQAHDEDEHEAVLDHECEHLLLSKDEDDAVKTDDAGRPVLKLKPHDVEVGWFTNVARRHKGKSVEVQQALRIREKYGQLLFDFPSADVDDATAAFALPGLFEPAALATATPV